ncbi:MAG: redoxin domain-containing protein [Candidatus Thorarchaeota archaeon]
MTSNDVSSLEVGDLAPDFVLPSTTSELVQLFSITDGPIILFFFTDTFSFLSLEFTKIFESLHESLGLMEVTIVGVSTEPVETLCTFADEERIQYILLSDFDRQVSRSYGTLAERISNLLMVTRPGIFVIDQERRIIFKWIQEESSPVPDITQIGDLVLKLQNDSCD